MNRLLVTGSSGLIGSEVVDYFCRLWWDIHGVDNNKDYQDNSIGVVRPRLRWHTEQVTHVAYIPSRKQRESV